jgi:hypothetical protein
LGRRHRPSRGRGACMQGRSSRLQAPAIIRSPWWSACRLLRATPTPRGAPGTRTHGAREQLADRHPRRRGRALPRARRRVGYIPSCNRTGRPACAGRAIHRPFPHAATLAARPRAQTEALTCTRNRTTSPRGRPGTSKYYMIVYCTNQRRKTHVPKRFAGVFMNASSAPPRRHVTWAAVMAGCW